MTASLSALRYGKWKMMFSEQRAHGFDVWQEPLVTLRFPKLFNLHQDPFERADHESIGYDQWRAERMYMLAPGAAYVAGFSRNLQWNTRRARSRAASTWTSVLESLQTGSGTTN